jgi:hypothetical protein
VLAVEPSNDSPDEASVAPEVVLVASSLPEPGADAPDSALLVSTVRVVVVNSSGVSLDTVLVLSSLDCGGFKTSSCSSAFFLSSFFFSPSAGGVFRPPKRDDPGEPALAKDEPPNAVANGLATPAAAGGNSNAGFPPKSDFPAVIDPPAPPNKDVAPVVAAGATFSEEAAAVFDVPLPRTNPCPENGAGFEVARETGVAEACESPEKENDDGGGAGLAGTLAVEGFGGVTVTLATGACQFKQGQNEKNVIR